MSEQELRNAGKLVEVFKARNDAEGNLVVGFLRDNGVEATFFGAAAVPLDSAEILESSDKLAGVYVLPENAERARQLVAEFGAGVSDEQELEDAAAQKPHPDKERIAELRGAIRDERRTFEFLGWVGVVFLAALAVLWAIWPEWLKVEAPAAFYRWTGVVLLAVAAMFAGSWTSRRM
jgi:hypothetical protein